MLITNTKEMSNHFLKIIIYGASGSGKTTLAKTIGEPTLIISSEAGLLSLQGSDIDAIDISIDDHGKAIPKEKRIARLGEVYSFLQTDAAKKYKWVFIDSLSELSQNLMEQLYLEFPERKDSLPMFGELSKRSRALIKGFRDLPNFNVVMTALDEVDKDEGGQRFTNIQMVGKISNQIPAMFDEVFYLHVQKEEDGNEKRVLVTSNSDKLRCKDRSGKLEKIEDANLGLIINKIRGTNKENK
jgi:phage nucleotide-binding protein